MNLPQSDIRALDFTLTSSGTTKPLCLFVFLKAFHSSSFSSAIKTFMIAAIHSSVPRIPHSIPGEPTINTSLPRIPHSIQGAPTDTSIHRGPSYKVNLPTQRLDPNECNDLGCKTNSRGNG